MRVVVMRHGKQESKPPKEGGIWQPDAPLQTGADVRIAVAAQKLRTLGFKFSTTSFWTSPYRRAKETVEIAMNTLGFFIKVYTVSERFAPAFPESWERMYGDWLKKQPDPTNPVGQQPADFLAMWPELCKAEAAWQWGGIRALADLHSSDSDDLLVVSHIPLINLAEWAATNTIAPRPALQYGECIVFEFDNIRMFSRTEHLHLV